MQTTMRSHITTLGVTALLLAPLCISVHGETPDANNEYDWLIGDVLAESDGTLLGLESIREFSLELAANTGSGDTEDVLATDAPAGAPPSDGNGQQGLTNKNDKTGTNPIQFTYDLRLYHEYQYLNTAGDGSQNMSTVEFRAPIADGKWQFRIKARANVLEADLNGDGSDDVDDSGLGDTDIRFLTVPYMNLQTKTAVAVAMEVFLDTASEDTLGSGSTVLGPQMFLAFFQPLGLPIDGFFPGYQYKFDVDGNNVRQSLIDLFVLKTFNNKQQWVLLDPQILIDHDNETEFLLFDIECGTMLGDQGHSAYFRPSFGVGSDRPYDASIEVGYKFVW